jgi:hypothetical protein
MKKKLFTSGIVVVAIFAFSICAEACSSDFDCGIGGTCIKTGRDMDGVCTNRFGASETRGREKYYEDDSPKDGWGSKAGKECSSRLDCGIGGNCIKMNNSMYGTCTD